MARFRLVTDSNPEKQNESFLSGLLRQGTTQVANAIAGPLTAPFEAIEGIRKVLTPENDFRENFQNLPQDAQQRLSQLPNIQEHLENPVEEYKPLGFPTRESVKQGAEQFFGLPEGYLEPQSENEKDFGDFVSDLATLASPINPIGKGLGIGRSLVASGLGNGLKSIAKRFGFKESNQELLKTGGLLFASLYPTESLRNINSRLYRESEKLVPPGIQTKGLESLNKDVRDINKLVKKGHVDLSTNSKKYLDSINESFNNPTQAHKLTKGLRVKDAIELKKAINEQLYSGASSGEIKSLTPLRNSLNRTIQSYGKTSNPQFLKVWNAAEDIHGTLEGLHGITKFIDKNVNVEKLSNPLTYVLLGHYPKKILQGIGAAIGGNSLVKGIQSAFKSKAVRDIYSDVIGSALKKNSFLLAKNIEKLDDAINRETNESNTGKGRYTLVQ